MKHRYLILLLGIFALSNCADNKEKGEFTAKKLRLKPTILEYVSQYHQYNSEFRDVEHLNESKTLYTKKIIISESTTYTYRYGEYTYVDSLVITKNSINLNGEKLYILNKKLINFRGRTIEVTKCQSFGKISNLFYVDSLGLILKCVATHPSGIAIVEINPKEFNEIHNSITKDSVFCELEFERKHMDSVFIFKELEQK